ncbi:MAG: flotillin-like FloA family protein, partial [Bacteroidetes bacterium]|nr:flotillin-like FloA family protein [Bacteroidota bacterium]
MLLIIVLGIIVGLFIFFYFIPLGLWFSALLSGVRISLLQLIFMRWRKVPPSLIVKVMINSTKAGLTLTRDEL